MLVILFFILFSSTFGKDFSELRDTYKIYFRELKTINRRSVSSLTSSKDWVITLERLTAKLNSDGFYINPFDLCLGLGLSNIVEFYLGWGNYNVKAKHFVYFEYMDFKPYEKKQKWKDDDFEHRCEKIDYKIENTNRLQSSLMEFGYRSGYDVKTWKNPSHVDQAQRWFKKEYQPSISVRNFHLTVLGEKEDEIRLEDVGKTIGVLAEHGGLIGLSLNDVRKSYSFLITDDTKDILDRLMRKFFGYIMNVDYQILLLSLHYLDLETAINVLEVSQLDLFVQTIHGDHEVKKFFQSEGRDSIEMMEKSNCFLLQLFTSQVISRTIDDLELHGGMKIISDECEFRILERSNRLLDLYEEKMHKFSPSRNECWDGYEENLEDTFNSNIEKVAENKRFQRMVQFMRLIGEKMELNIIQSQTVVEEDEL